MRRQYNGWQEIIGGCLMMSFGLIVVLIAGLGKLFLIITALPALYFGAISYLMDKAINLVLVPLLGLFGIDNIEVTIFQRQLERSGNGCIIYVLPLVLFPATLIALLISPLLAIFYGVIIVLNVITKGWEKWREGLKESGLDGFIAGNLYLAGGWGMFIFALITTPAYWVGCVLPLGLAWYWYYHWR